MWWKRKKVEVPIVIPTVEVVEPKVEKVPKKTTYKATMEITLINNKTDKEYIIKSENDFGLRYINSNTDESLLIRQIDKLDESEWHVVGRFYDFSIAKMIWKDFDIKED